MDGYEDYTARSKQSSAKRTSKRRVEERRCYSYDGRTEGAVPELIVFPSSPLRMSAILEARQHASFSGNTEGPGNGSHGRVGAGERRRGALLHPDEPDTGNRCGKPHLRGGAGGDHFSSSRRRLQRRAFFTLPTLLRINIRASGGMWRNARVAPILSSMA